MKKNYFILFILFAGFIGFLHPTESFGVTANPNPVEYRQPDGSILTLIMRGDEFIHWAMTTDGYTLLPDSSHAYEYANVAGDGNLTFSGIMAHNPGSRSTTEENFLKTIGKTLFFSESQLKEMKSFMKSSRSPGMAMSGGFPTTGIRSHLLILANFNNTTTTYAQSDFDNMMNQVNYNNTGSFRDFYLEVSWGQLTVNTTVTVWVTLPNTHNYYGPQAMWGQFAYDAIVAADQQANVDFSLYDNDQDGVVDGICIAHQGRGQEESGSTNDIWSHSWDLTSAGYTPAQRMFDGVEVLDYTTIPEKRGPSGISTIGVMCHEFGHNLGAPDFYDTDYSTGGQYDGTGYWDLMSDGSWNGYPAGARPAHHNAWTKVFYNWCSPVVLDAPQTVVVRDIKTYPDVYRYNTASPNEYFLCENRQMTGFNASLPGHGMIIYHVDGNYISSHFSPNDINCSSHQGLYPMSANATTGNGIMPGYSSTINSAGCPWPGSSGKTTFTDTTMPWSKSWSGATTDKPLMNITENNSTHEILFCFFDCPDTLNPQNLIATAAGSARINLSWQKNTAGNPVMVAFSLTGTFGIPATGSAYVPGDTIPGGGIVIFNDTIDSYSHTGLNANTLYYYKAWSVMGGQTFSAGVTDSATTFCSPYSLPFTESFTDMSLPSCWSDVDHISSGQAWQFGVMTGFTPAPNLTGGYAYLNSKAYGAGNTQNADLITPTINCSGYQDVTLRFNHCFNYATGTSATVSYSTDDGATWTEIQTWTGATGNPEPFSQVISALDNQGQAKIKWNFRGSYGLYWSIDDIELTGTATGPMLNVSPPNQNVTHVPGSTTFSVTSNMAWNVASDQTWCVPTPGGSGNGTIAADYTENLTAIPRTANLTVSASGVSPVVVTVTQEGNVGIPALSERDIRIVPNPNNGHFRLAGENLSGKTLTVTVYDQSGKQIRSGVFSGAGSYDFNMEGQPAGEYMMKIKYNGRLITKKLILK